MKKLGKLLTSIAVIGGLAAGVYAIYKKFFAETADGDNFDEDFEDDFEEDLEEPKREYVSLNSVQEETTSEVSAEAIAEKEAAMAEAETAKAEENAE